jgi:hypothetical protein
VIALIAISSGSSSGSIYLRRIRMSVSSRPRRSSPAIWVVELLIGRVVLVGPERVQLRCVARPRRELCAWDEPAASLQRHELADPATAAGDDERLRPSTASVISLDLWRRSRWVISGWADMTKA